MKGHSIRSAMHDHLPDIPPPTAIERMMLRLADERGSAAVEYVGLALVISMLTAAIGSAIDSALGERLARAVVERLIAAVASTG